MKVVKEFAPISLLFETEDEVREIVSILGAVANDIDFGSHAVKTAEDLCDLLARELIDV